MPPTSAWATPELRTQIESRLRSPGKLHEWFMVSRADKFKAMGVTAEQIAEYRTPIKQVEFVNPAGRHGGLGSTVAHNEILRIIDSISDPSEFLSKLKIWADKRLSGGSNALPNIVAKKL